jgi:uncharacterized protein
MRRKEKEIKEMAIIDTIIKEAQVCRLAMVDQDKPYVVPLSFGYDGAHIYFHSALEGRKIEVLRKNPHVCFEFDQVIKLKKHKEACEWGMSFKSVIGEGQAILVEEITEKIHALGVIMAQYSQRRFEFSRESMEKTAVIKVVIRQITGKQG